MVTVLRADGLRIIIYVNDHQPAHVHVFGDGEAKISIAGPGPPQLLWADGMARNEVRRAMRVVTNNCIELRKRWEEIHGRAN